jgi:Amt family ammonium transporter
VTVAYTFVVTFIIYKLVDLVIGVRIADEEEAMGLDLTQHNERAYTMLE